MNKQDVVKNLKAVAEARHERNKIDATFRSDVTYVMNRLLMEAAVNMMSADEVAAYSGYTVTGIKDLQRSFGLSPSKGQALMAREAAEALADNAAIMGVEPHEMDLTSPLAYLPMGSELRKKFLEATTSKVTELPDAQEAWVDYAKAHFIDPDDDSVVRDLRTAFIAGFKAAQL